MSTHELAESRQTSSPRSLCINTFEAFVTCHRMAWCMYNCRRCSLWGLYLNGRVYFQQELRGKCWNLISNDHDMRMLNANARTYGARVEGTTGEGRREREGTHAPKHFRAFPARQSVWLTHSMLHKVFLLNNWPLHIPEGRFSPSCNNYTTSPESIFHYSQKHSGVFLSDLHANEASCCSIRIKQDSYPSASSKVPLQTRPWSVSLLQVRHMSWRLSHS